MAMKDGLIEYIMLMIKNTDNRSGFMNDLPFRPHIKSLAEEKLVVFF